MTEPSAGGYRPPPAYGGHAPSGYPAPVAGPYFPGPSAASPYPPGPWTPPPTPRPGVALASSVLAYIQCSLVLMAALVVLFFASFLSEIFAWLAGAQIVSGLLLVVAGVRLADGVERFTMIGACGTQFLIIAGWYALVSVDGLDNPEFDRVFFSFQLYFAALPAVSLLLCLLPPTTAWLRERR